MKKWLFLLGLCGATVEAGTLELTIEIPQLDVAEYHRPYVAIWLEDEQGRVVKSLAVLYEQTDWLKDLRQWWRKDGRQLTLPIDGVSGASPPVGFSRLSWQDNELPLRPGLYRIHVEVAREVGGREKLSLELRWPLTQTATVTGQGSQELGAVTLKYLH